MRQSILLLISFWKGMKMRAGIKCNISKLLQIVCIVVISTMTTGCTRMVVGAFSATAGPSIIAETMKNQGINMVPPNVASITAYKTDDPELKIFLTYLSALENGVEGIRGETIKAEEFEGSQYSKEEIRKNITKSYDDLPGLSAYQKSEAIEKAMEMQIKYRPQMHLKVIPVGADPKSSYLSTQVQQHPAGEGYDLKTTTITAGYEFKSKEEMARKSNEIESKLRPFIAMQQGWKIDDLAAAKKRLADYIEATNKKELQAVMSPEYISKNRKMIENSVKRYEAGFFNMSYGWTSDYLIKSAGIATPYIDMLGIIATTQPESLDGNYVLSVGVSKTVTQPRIKL